MDRTSALLRIFPNLPRSLVRRMADLSGMQRIGKGSLLFREGERADFVHALVEGRVSLISGRKREETIADFMGPGDVLLVPPALLQLPYMVTAKAVTDLLVVLIPAEEFRQMAETELALAVTLNSLLARHWRLLLRHLTQTKSRDADARLVQFLIDGAGVSRGAARFTLPGSKQDVAAHLGVTPATLSRAFRRLSSLGVKTAGPDVLIEDVARLNTFSQSQAMARMETGA